MDRRKKTANKKKRRDAESTIRSMLETKITSELRKILSNMRIILERRIDKQNLIDFKRPKEEVWKRWWQGRLPNPKLIKVIKKPR